MVTVFILRRAIEDEEEDDVMDESRLSIRRSSTPCLERRRLSSRRKSIPAYLGEGKSYLYNIQLIVTVISYCLKTFK